MKTYENEYFTFIRTEKESQVFLDVVRKRPTLPGAFVELLELASVPLIENPSCLLAIQSDDNYLLRDLQKVGFVIKGYLVERESGQSNLLWDSSRNEEFISLGNINEIANNKVRRIVLKSCGELKHPVNFGSKEAIDLLRKRERYLNGLTEFYYDPEEETENYSKTYYTKDNRKIDSFNELIDLRKSATSFESGLSNDQLMNVLNDTLSWTDKFSRPFPCAGGFGTFNAFVITESGKYKFNPEKNQIEKAEFNLDNSTIYELGGEISMFENCKTWIILTANMEKNIEKYASRAYRFSLIESGAIMQQIHLSCASFGFDCRILGGFDDRLVETMLNLNENEFVMAMMGMGAK